MTGTYRQPGTILTDHVVSAPLDHDDPAGERIEVFAREVVAADRASEKLPYLLFLQGGPGMKANRPVGQEGWIGRALADFRVVLLDQRGTGRSTPVTRQTLPRRGGARAQAEYLRHFRADAIVRDAELIRRQLLGPDTTWSVLGQSYGGFCATTYLSLAPEGLCRVFLTGGLPGIHATADDVYRRTYPLVAARTAEHYARYPEDVARVREITEALLERPATLPDGGRLTAAAFQTLGQDLGMSTGSHTLHYLFEEAFVRGAAGPEFSDTFLAEVQNRISFVRGPLYALLHEACYAQGAATAWAAQRVRDGLTEFDAADALKAGRPVPFTGEMIYPWMFETDPALQPAAEAAHLLAERSDWPALYDARRLAANDVPVVAAVYHDDMYVEREFSLQTAAAIRGARVWITNEYQHDGLRLGGTPVLDRLIRMARGLE